MKLDKKTLRVAHEWLVAIELGDTDLLRQLADPIGVPFVAEPQAVFAGPPSAEVLTRVLGAVMAAAARTRPAVDAGVLARVAATLYTLAGRGLEIDEAAATSAINLARG